MKPYIIPFEKLKNKDVELVGGKNASIGEMISGLATLGVSVQVQVIRRPPLFMAQ